MSLKLISFHADVQKRIEQEAELVVRGYFMSNIWDRLTDEQKKFAIQPVITAMSQVVSFCSAKGTFTTERTLDDLKED